MLIMKFLAIMHHLLKIGEGGKLQFPNFLKTKYEKVSTYFCFKANYFFPTCREHLKNNFTCTLLVKVERQSSVGAETSLKVNAMTLTLQVKQIIYNWGRCEQMKIESKSSEMF